MSDNNIPSQPSKDKWDKTRVILGPLGGLLTAFAVALVGFFGSRVLEQRQTLDSNYRLYSELMSKREESESLLRKDMFKSIIESFLKDGSTKNSLDASLLNLELLAYNFHESLNLKPLFIYLERAIHEEKDPVKKNDFLNRLERVAREVARKQMLILEGAGKKFERTIDLESLRNSPGGIQLDEDTLTVEGIKRNIRVVVLEADSMTHNIKVRLEIRTLNNTTMAEETASTAEFWVGFFDFPMIDNTRLSNDQRCAVVLTDFEDFSAEISVLDYPGSHASLKEKPYFDEIIQNLWRQNQQKE
jgi:hypothetical protein